MCRFIEPPVSQLPILFVRHMKSCIPFIFRHMVTRAGITQFRLVFRLVSKGCHNHQPLHPLGGKVFKEPGHMPHPVSLPKATTPINKCQVGIPATQGIPQPQEHIQVRCTHLQHRMQHQGACLPILLLRGMSCTLHSRCHLSMEISPDQQAHLQPVNHHHHHRTTIKLILFMLLYFWLFPLSSTHIAHCHTAIQACLDGSGK